MTMHYQPRYMTYSPHIHSIQIDMDKQMIIKKICVDVSIKNFHDSLRRRNDFTGFSDFTFRRLMYILLLPF